jgi:hypothetical protein
MDQKGQSRRPRRIAERRKMARKYLMSVRLGLLDSEIR